MSEESLRDLIQDTPEEDPALLAEAQGVVDSLTKTVKTFNTYPRENTISITAIDNLARSFSDYLDKHGSLEIFVNRHELLFRNTPVYSEKDPRRSLALKLDRDGIRRVLFYKGMARPEVVSLLETLTAHVNEESLDDDVVTLLWEKHLEHVKVFVLDDLGGGDAGRFDQNMLGGATLDLGDAPESGSSMSAKPLAAPKLKAEGMSGGQGDQQAVCDSVKRKIQPATEEQMSMLMDRTRQEESHDVSGDLESILFDVLRTKTQSEVYANACKVLVELVIMHVRGLSFEGASGLLDRMRAMAADDGTDREVRLQLVAHYQTIAEPARIDPILETLRQHENLNASELTRFLTMLPASAAAGLCPLLEVERYDGIVSDALRHLVKDDPRALAGQVGSDNATIAKKVLGVIEAYAGADLVKALAPALLKAEDSVRTASMKLLERAKCPESRDLLLGFATSLNAGVRRAALRALSSGVTPSGQPTPLRAEALVRDFDQRSLDEKKMLFVALARVEGALAAKFLARILDQRKWFEKPAHAETRACAAVALGEIEDEEAVAALERHASDKSQTVRTAVGVALSRGRTRSRVPESSS